MSEVHGIVYAYRSSARLGDLTRWRTNASLPFCGRYRLIDFALSSLSNAGVHSVGVIMQRDYQSLLDHLGSGKAWDLSRRSGGLHLLPPFGANTRGDYAGTAEALNAVISYVRAIPEPEIVLMPADVVCNLDLAAAIAQHEAGGCGITAICRDGDVTGEHHRFLTDAHGRVTKLITSAAPDAGLTSMEAYIVNKDVLARHARSLRAGKPRILPPRRSVFLSRARRHDGRVPAPGLRRACGYGRGLFFCQYGHAGTVVARLALPG